MFVFREVDITPEREAHAAINSYSEGTITWDEARALICEVLKDRGTLIHALTHLECARITKAKAH